MRGFVSCCWLGFCYRLRAWACVEVFLTLSCPSGCWTSAGAACCDCTVFLGRFHHVVLAFIVLFLDSGAGLKGINQTKLTASGEDSFHTACTMDCGGRPEHHSPEICKFPVATRPSNKDVRPRRNHNHLSHGWQERQSHRLRNVFTQFSTFPREFWTLRMFRGDLMLDFTSKFSADQQKHK